MPQSTADLTAALARLNGALDGLESAVQTSAKTRADGGNKDADMQRMAMDRAKLARDLDAATAKAQRLDDITSDVSRRIVGVMERVRTAMDQTS